MNEKHVQEVVEIEKQAQAILDAATRDAERLPLEADREGQLLIEKARASAREEARRIVAEAQAQDQVDQIMAGAQQRIRDTETLAQKNFDRALAYVLGRVMGKE